MNLGEAWNSDFPQEFMLLQNIYDETNCAKQQTKV
jgi:hypothetical protein